MRLCDALRGGSWSRPEPQILSDEGKSPVGYGDLLEMSVSLGAGIRTRIGENVTVAALLPNSVELLALYFGCAQAGHVLVPLDTRLKPAEIERLLDRFRPDVIATSSTGLAELTEARSSSPSWRIVLTGDDNPDRDGRHLTFAEIVDAGEADDRAADPSDPDAACIVFCSSGTTGTPKGIVHTQRSLMYNATSIQSRLMFRAEDCCRQVLPLSGINFVWLLSFLIGKSDIILDRRFVPDVLLTSLSTNESNCAIVAPVMLDMLLDTAEQRNIAPIETARIVGYGGSLTSQSTAERAHAQFPNSIRQMYGQTELGLISSKGSEQHPIDWESAGKPFLSVDVAVLDESGEALPPGQVGEIAVRSPGSYLGYWKGAGEPFAAQVEPGATWVHTGDTGNLDEHGNVKILGRVDDLIVTGANNVYPREVEEVLRRSALVDDVIVLGVPDARWGQVVAAVVVPAPGASSDVLDRLDELCRDSLSSAKVPRKWHVANVLPRTSTGKVQKQAVIDKLMA